MNKKNLAILISGMMFFSSSSAIFADNTTKQERLIGKTRYETAVEVSKLGWVQSKTAIIVNGNSIQSALCANPFAKLKNAPILLVNNNSIENSTKAELKRLGVDNVYIVDSGNSISSKVENEIKSLNIKINKIVGNNIYEMSTNVLKEIDKIKKVENIAVVNGLKGLSDAVSIASPAAIYNMPIILVSDENSNDSSINFLNNRSIKKSYIVGGNKILSDNTVKKYPNRERISGSDRNNTNAKIIDKFYKDKKINNVFVAKDGINQENALVDSLSIGVLAAKENSPIMISNGSLVNSQKEFIKNKDIDEITQVGGGYNQKAFEDILKLKNVNIRNKTKKISLIQAKEILKQALPGSNILVCYYDEDDNEYDCKVIKDNILYEIEIDAYSGKIIEIEKDDDLNDNNLGTQNISLDKAKSIALDAVPNGNLIYCKYDAEDNEYEAKVIKNKKTYELEISAFDGRIVDIDMDNDSDDDFDDNDKNNSNTNDNSSIISAEKAKSIMLDKVPGGKIVKFKYDEDDKEYEGEIIKGKTEYEITINAITGKILEFEIDD
ncbi:cell wall-binding protein Cwp21 [Clostridioides difficile]|uniref:cell wall-binding protein Cwp21 n=1 Tax=Clostridioides difficile TaxID=1496 RepID=UPI000C9AA8E3|nr:cell wall-binding protein Cwp21 [Clostridioides difficile]MDI3073978.1 cell wall-binding protein Cwp21 [Clostridioides difficile]MDK3167871.1 cell wall-binding protein Cwp21 [Clostridioides difficile]